MSGGIRRIDCAYGWIVVILAVATAVGCGGGGCGGCATFEPIPGGFPANKRTPNAVQVRVTQTGLQAIEANPAALLGSIGGGANGVLKFPAPASCGGSTPICCPGGVPKANCGPIDIDLNKQAGDLPRLELKPAQGASRLDVTVRARVKTETDIPVTVPLIGDCGVKIDTNAGSAKDLQIDAPISFSVIAKSNTTSVVVGDVTLNNLETNDVALTGSVACQLANLGLSFFINILKDQITGAIKSAIQDQTCKQCPSGSVSECGPFATACTNNVCQQDGACQQELGLSGRARGSSLFGSLSPGTTGALDLYEVAGGYATTNTNGIALGLLGGMLPGGTARDRCGPPGVEPAPVAITPSATFQGNADPNGKPFGIGIGLHKSQLAEFAYAGYDGGLLCLTLSHNTISQLSTDTLSILSRSMGKLVEGNAPVAVGLRPQSAPVITLGRNIFVSDGMGGQTLMEPLLDIKFTGMEIDFFTSIDDQFVRVMTVVTDVHLPVGLQPTAMGQIAPVIANPSDAFTNLQVKNTEALTETPADLAAVFPTVLGLVIPQLSNGIAPISLPALGGLNLKINSITAVDNLTYMAIFADLAPATLARPVDTYLSIADVSEPAVAIQRDPTRWKGSVGPSVRLDLGGDRGGLEWSVRVDGGTWQPWGTNPHPVIAEKVFWLPGKHTIDVRAREIGKPETIDETPAHIDVMLGKDLVRNAGPRPFHGQPGEGGCQCGASGSATSAAPFALVFAIVMLPLRRLRRRVGRSARRAAKQLGTIVLLAALFSLPGCSCGSAPCGDMECLPGNVDHGGLGRYTSIASDDQRVIVATYDNGLGDLVAADATDPTNLVFTAVDGFGDATPTHDPSTYRHGIEDPGPNVGAWTSVALSNGLAKIAYQDRDAKALKYAFERSKGDWAFYTIDSPDPGEELGRYASLVIDKDNHPAVAYLALGIDDGMGNRVTELRIARSNVNEPGAGDWQIVKVAEAHGTCAGLCRSGEACVNTMMGQKCITPSTDCNPGCGSGSVCSAGACTDAFEDPQISVLATGTGLFASLVVLPDGRLAVTYYNPSKRQLAISVESGAGANQFTETVLDGDPMAASGDTGLWSTAAVDGAGTIHVAYQDAISDTVRYTVWNGTPGTPEVVDDGVRTGDRTHTVGAAAAIFVQSGAPSIAYQDGMTSDVYLATKGTTWSANNIAQGPLLDGFSIGVTQFNGRPVFAWGRIDPNATPINQLAVQKQ